ncbi:MAG: protein kinase [Gemmatimonadales bacterium]|nr:protein kinase [Gemmatimonadales bacterium]
MTDAAVRLAAALDGRYRLERELGAGGMATVYVADDLRHDRKVAVKVLRPELSAVIGAGRFLREIKTIAGLQHPHILGLIDSGEVDGTAFYVMPFVAGESLRDRLARETQLPIAEAVRLASEIASALDYAHRNGVIHRDVKPENILLHDGRAMVADFGIALAVSSAGGTRMTETGMSLGTPTYMSPEQAMGEREITAKSDVYSLGCVLYEMLVGEPPFTGPTAQAIIAKLMTDDPRPPRQLRRTVPASVEEVTLTALARLPADRFASAAAMLDALSVVTHETAARVPAAVAPGRAPRGGGVVRSALLVALGAVAASLAWLPWRRPAAAPGEVRRQVTYSGRAQAPAISNDGRFLAYLEQRCSPMHADSGCVRLMVVEVGGTRPLEIVSGARRLSRPRWTHDGLSIVFAGVLGEGKSGLFVVPRLGGLPRRVADEPLAYDTHARADSVALALRRDSATVLEVVDLASGGAAGAPIPVTGGVWFLAWSPDGRTLALTSADTLFLVARDGAERSRVARLGMRAPVRWSTDGRSLLFFEWTEGVYDELVALDVREDGRVPAPRRLASQVPTMYRGEFDVARETGRVVVGSGFEFADIWSFDVRPGAVRAERLTQGSNWHGAPVLSADGRALYFLRADQLGNNLYRLLDGRETALTAERQIVNYALRLSVDGRAITFESQVGSAPVLMLHELASGATRQVPRGYTDVGWLLAGGSRLLWINPWRGRVWSTDVAGRDVREIAEVSGTSPFAQLGAWRLSPGGDALVTLRGTPDAMQPVIVPLDGRAPRLLDRPLARYGPMGLVTWAPDGTIYVAQSDPAAAQVTVVGVDAATGARRESFVLPAMCEPIAVSYVPAARRAACTASDRRLDLVVLDGVVP